MWETIVGKLIGGFAPEVVGYYKQKTALKHERVLAKIKGKIAWEEAKTKRASESEGRDADWESQSIANSGWKDEGTWIVLSLPLVGVFIPGVAEYVLQGFQILEQTPEWYRWMIDMIYAATFGIRVWRRKT